MSDSESYSSGSSNADPIETSWDDWTEDSAPATSLFSPDVFPSAQAALDNDKNVHGVDVVLLAATLGKLHSAARVGASPGKKLTVAWWGM